jgi:hypothetical protein
MKKIKDMILRSLKAALLLLLLSCSATLLKAQLNIPITPPNPEQLSAQTLFQFEVINHTQNVYHVDIEAQLSLSSSSPVYMVHYRNLEIQPGITEYNFSNLHPEQESYGGNTQAQTFQSTGLVPYGGYVICINATDLQTGDNIGNNCLEQTFGPHTPPALLSPDDEAEVETLTPLLSWIPPSPLQPDMNLTYDLKLVEIQGSQSSYEAIERNPPIFYQSGIATNMLQYAAGSYPLEYGKSYAWQVRAKSGDYDLGETEVWRFKPVSPQTDSLSPKEPEAGYLKLKPTLDGSYSPIAENLKFEFRNDYRQGVLKYRITDLNGKEFTPDFGLQSAEGINHFSIPLKSKADLKNNTIYLLEVYTQKNERKVLMFRYFSSRDELEKYLKKSAN